MSNNKIQFVDAEELFSCPVCLDTPEDKIFLCKNGHSVCSKCLITLKACAECRVPLGPKPTRNLSLEAILDKATVPCAFKDAGCPDKMKRMELPSHKKICLFRSVNVCRRFGYYLCNTMASTAEELRKHLDTGHKVTIDQTKPDNTFIWALNNLHPKTYGTRIKRITNGSQNEQFVVIVNTNQDSIKNDLLSYTVMYIGNMSQIELQSRKDFNVTIGLSILQENQKVHLRSSTETPLYFKGVEDYHLIPYTRLAFSYIKTRLDPNKQCNFDFELEVKIPSNLGDMESNKENDGNSDDIGSKKSPDVTDTNAKQSRKRSYNTRSTGNSNKKIKRK